MNALVPDYADKVLTVAESIPPGRVMTYGDVARWLGEGGPRQVGRAMSHFGGSVPWWRVVRADGVILPSNYQAALTAYQQEATPLRETAGARRIDVARARWDADEAVMNTPPAV